MNTISKIGVAVLLVAIVVAGGAFMYMRSVSASNSLTSLNTNDATAYRYTQMAKYYTGTGPLPSDSKIFSMDSGYPLSGTNLENASPADEMAFRYQALANYYANQSSNSR